MAEGDEDDAIRAVERTDAHEPLETNSALGDAPVVVVDERTILEDLEEIDDDDDLEEFESLDQTAAATEAELAASKSEEGLAGAAAAAAMLSPEEAAALEAADLPAGADENDRTAAQDSPFELFSHIPDPEEAPVPQPLHVGPAQRKFQQAPTAFLPAVKVDAAAAPRAAAASAPAAVSRPVVVARPAAKAPKKRKAKPVPRPVGQLDPRPTPSAPPSGRTNPPAPEIPSVIYVDEESEEHTNIYRPPSERAELPRGRLVVTEGDQRGKTWYLNRGRTRLGRGTDNDIVLLDIAVSRNHVRIDRHADGFRLEDLSSGNGTFVNKRRVTRCELYDGDQLEVGNLVLEYTTVGSPRLRVDSEPARVTDPSVAIAASPLPRRGPTPLWLGIWVLGTFLAVVAGMLVTRALTDRGADADEVAPSDQAAAYVSRARQAMARGEWVQARQDLEVAAQLGYANPAELARVNREAANQRAIAAAKARLDVAEYAEIEALLAAVGSDSALAMEKQGLLAKAQTRSLDRQVEQAEAALAKGQLEVARLIAEKVLKQDAGHARARKVVEAVESTPRTAEEPPKPSPRSGGGGSDATAEQAMASGTQLYRRGRFADAVVAFDRAGRAAGSERLRRQARARSGWVKSFSAALRTGTDAARRRDNRAAVRALEEALDFDRKLGGAQRGRINKALVDPYYFSAIDAFSRERYEQAVAANKKVLRIDPGHALARRLATKMEQKAGDLVRTAMRYRGDPRRARGFARAALALARPGSPEARDAQRLLDQL